MQKAAAGKLPTKRLSKAARALAEELRGTDPTAFAAGCLLSPAALYGYTRSGSLPRVDRAILIQKRSRGRVRVFDWVRP